MEPRFWRPPCHWHVLRPVAQVMERGNVAVSTARLQADNGMVGSLVPRTHCSRQESTLCVSTAGWSTLTDGRCAAVSWKFTLVSASHTRADLGDSRARRCFVLLNGQRN